MGDEAVYVLAWMELRQNVARAAPIKARYSNPPVSLNSDEYYMLELILVVGMVK